MASGTSVSEYVLSITGVTLPASMSSFRNCRSSLLGFTVKFTSFWLTNGDNRRALMMRPIGPIQRPSDSPLTHTNEELVGMIKQAVLEDGYRRSRQLAEGSEGDGQGRE